MRNLKLAPNISSNIPQIIDITDQLYKAASWESLKKKYIVKGQWDGKTWHTGFRKPEDIDTIIIHHSGPPNGSLQSHARYHARKWGAGIAYHVAIDEDQIKQVNNLLSFTYQAGGNNTYTVGIVVNRDLTKVDLTPRERELLYAAILSVKAAIPTIKHIKGHREVSPTACPVTSMDRIRADILAMEEELSFQVDTSALSADAYKLAVRVRDLQGKLKHPTWGKEAARKLGTLNGVIDGSTDVIGNTVLALYKSANDAQFIGDDADKLRVIVEEAKKVKLI